MSAIRTYKAWEDVDISIEPWELSTTDLISLMIACEKAFNQKMEKLGSIIKPMNIFIYDNALLINDEYSTCADFKNIIEALGFKCKEIEFSLSGRSYVISDPIIDSLIVMNPKYMMPGNFSKASLDIINVIKNNAIRETFSKELTEIIYKLVTEGKLSVKGKQEITEREMDGRIIGRDSGRIQSEEKVRVSGLAKDFFSSLQKKLNNVNNQLQEGTVSILNSTAKKLNYSVQQRKVGNAIELVYERVV